MIKMLKDRLRQAECQRKRGVKLKARNSGAEDEGNVRERDRMKGLDNG